MKLKELSWKILTFNITGRQFKMTDFLIEKVTFHYYNILCGVGEVKGKRSEIGLFFKSSTFVALSLPTQA